MTPRVLALDLSLSATGVADALGTRTIKPTTTGVERLAEIRDEVLYVAGMAHTHTKVDLVALEGYSYGSPNRAHQLGELGGVVRLALHRAGLRWIVVPPSSVKKYASGKGNASKAEVLGAAIRKLDYAGFDDNEADALMLRALVLDALGAPLVKMPAKNREAVAGVVRLLDGAGVAA